MSKKETQGTNGYVAKINKMIRQKLGEVPGELYLLIQKTAQDMRMLDRITAEIDSDDSLLSIDVGSQGQNKTVVNPLVPYYEKMSSRVTDDLYNLGLTARRQAAPVATEEKKDEPDGVIEFLKGRQQR